MNKDQFTYLNETIESLRLQVKELAGLLLEAHQDEIENGHYGDADEDKQDDNGNAIDVNCTYCKAIDKAEVLS